MKSINDSFLNFPLYVNIIVLNLNVTSRFLVNKTNRRTEFQFLLVIITLHVSGNLSAHRQELLSRTTALVLFTRELNFCINLPTIFNFTSVVFTLLIHAYLQVVQQ
jgi:hypothetical protein